jgi:hypothetical protein
MNPSTPESTEDLIIGFIEGDLDEAGCQRLADWLAEDPTNAQRLGTGLQLADLLEQTLIPHRRLPAFLNGLETRFHAEATADEFLKDLLPRLREVEQRQAQAGTPASPSPGKIIRMPLPWRTATSIAAAAAAVTVAALLGFARRPEAGAPSLGVAKLAQTSSDIVWSKSNGTSGSIEWELGSTIPAGASIRLESGTARFDLADGGVLTLEGPADLQLESPSEARLVKGNVLATVSPGVTPVTIHAPGMHYEVDGSTTGVRTLDGNKLEASVLSNSGKVTATSGADQGSSKAIGPKEALLTHAEEGLKELIPIDPAAYQNHFNLLAGITDHSHGVAVATPEQKIPGAASPIVVALEKEGVEPQAPVRVDITPDRSLTLSHARRLSLPNRPAVAAGTRMRSYVIDVAPQAAKPGPGQAAEAFIQFDKRIVGIAATRDTMSGSDGIVGTATAPAPEQGLPDGDALSISEDGRTLRIRLKDGERNALASFRVFVQDHEISNPRTPGGAAWAAPRIQQDETPNLTGKDPDAKP